MLSKFIRRWKRGRVGILSEEYEASITIIELLARIFAEPENARYERVIELKPTIIQGGRGSGKSMILKSMEAIVVAYRHRTKPFKDLNIEYFGVYCRLTQGSFATIENSILKYLQEEVVLRLFTNEIILRLTQSLLEEIENCIDSGILNNDSKAQEALAKCISFEINPNRVCQDIASVQLEIKLGLRAINEYLTRKIMGEDIPYTGTFLGKD